MPDKKTLDTDVLALLMLHGRRAHEVARMSAGKLAVKGDFSGAATWRRIADAIDRLKQEIPNDAPD